MSLRNFTAFALALTAIFLLSAWFGYVNAAAVARVESPLPTTHMRGRVVAKSTIGADEKYHSSKNLVGGVVRSEQGAPADEWKKLLASREDLTTDEWADRRERLWRTLRPHAQPARLAAAERWEDKDGRWRLESPGIFKRDGVGEELRAQLERRGAGDELHALLASSNIAGDWLLSADFFHHRINTQETRTAGEHLDVLVERWLTEEGVREPLRWIEAYPGDARLDWARLTLLRYGGEAATALQNQMSDPATAELARVIAAVYAMNQSVLRR